MNSFIPDRIREGTKIWFLIRCAADHSIEPLSTRYLVFRTKTKASPNTVKRIAFSVSYYLTYLDILHQDTNGVLLSGFTEQFEHFTSFLEWLKNCGHTGNHKGSISENSCNSYLGDVFGWYRFMAKADSSVPPLKVLEEIRIMGRNSKGVLVSRAAVRFRGRYHTHPTEGRTIKEDSLIQILESCTNIRDRLLLLMLAETGLRIGEILGIRYGSDIDYDRHTIRVRFRDGNDNGARAKYREERQMLISDETFDILCCYLSRYRKYLKNTEYLFVVIDGKTCGEPLSVSAVYSMLAKAEKKTGIKATPHMLRHYFANERRKSGWPILLISRALGHRHLSTTEEYMNIENSELEIAEKDFLESREALMNVKAVL